MLPDWSRIKWYGLLAIGILFTIGGAAMVVSGAQHGWVALLFFGMCTVVFAAELWPGLFLQRAAPVESLLQRFPGPLVLTVDRLKFVGLAVGAAIFGGVSYWILRHEPLGWVAATFLWLGVIGCAAAIPLMIVLVFQGSSLRLDADGLDVRQGWRRHRSRWAETSAFDVARLPAGTLMVVYDDATSRNHTLGAINARILGRSGGLPDTYGMSHEELAWLLNRWRERASAEQGR
jgi:hypothetical protein